MLGGSVEDNALTGLVWNDRLAPQIALKIKASDFSTQTYRRIAEAALDFLQRHNRPARTHIVDILEVDIKRGNDGQFMSEILQEMEKRLAPELNEEFVLSELDKFLAIQRLTVAVNQASDKLSNGELDEAREILRAPDLLPKDTPGVFLRDTERWFSFLREDDDRDLFSSGIDTLDERHVRPARGELFMLLAASGMGKSWFLIGAGKRNVLAERKNVLHITLENSLEITLQRYTQAFLSLTRDESRSVAIRVFKRPGDDPTAAHLDRDNPTADSIKGLGRYELERRLQPYQTRGGGHLLVKHFPTGTLTMGMLIAYLDALEQTERFKPDLILLDYLTMMNIDTRDMRISIGQLTRNLRGLASLRDFALITVIQANRLGQTAQLVRRTHTGEDLSIAATSDTFLTYSQTPHEKDLRIARIMVDKARNSQDRWLALITQAYELGQFCLDSNYMTDSLRNQLAEGEADDA